MSCYWKYNPIHKQMYMYTRLSIPELSHRRPHFSAAACSLNRRTWRQRHARCLFRDELTTNYKFSTISFEKRFASTTSDNIHYALFADRSVRVEALSNNNRPLRRTPTNLRIIPGHWEVIERWFLAFGRDPCNHARGPSSDGITIAHTPLAIHSPDTRPVPDTPKSLCRFFSFFLHFPVSLFPLPSFLLSLSVSVCVYVCVPLVDFFSLSSPFFALFIRPSL